MVYKNSAFCMGFRFPPSRLKSKKLQLIFFFFSILQVDYTYIKTFQDKGRHHHGVEHLSTSTTQLTLDIMETHVGPSGFVELTCLSTIPGYLDDEDEKYADERSQTISG